MADASCFCKRGVYTTSEVEGKEDSGKKDKGRGALETRDLDLEQDISVAGMWLFLSHIICLRAV